MADNLFYVQGKFPAIATPHDAYMAWAFTVRDRLLHRWIQTAETYLKQKGHKLVCYLSAEYLLGPQLGDNVLKLDLHARAQKAAEASGQDLSALLEQEPEPGLGNGDWDAWLPATWTLYPRWKSPPSAMASVMNSASFSRRFATGGRWKRPTSG